MKWLHILMTVAIVLISVVCHRAYLATQSEMRTERLKVEADVLSGRIAELSKTIKTQEFLKGEERRVTVQRNAAEARVEEANKKERELAKRESELAKLEGTLKARGHETDVREKEILRQEQVARETLNGLRLEIKDVARELGQTNQQFTAWLRQMEKRKAQGTAEQSAREESLRQMDARAATAEERVRTLENIIATLVLSTNALTYAQLMTRKEVEVVEKRVTALRAEQSKLEASCRNLRQKQTDLAEQLTQTRMKHEQDRLELSEGLAREAQTALEQLRKAQNEMIESKDGLTQMLVQKREEWAKTIDDRLQKVVEDAATILSDKVNSVGNGDVKETSEDPSVN